MTEARTERRAASADDTLPLDVLVLGGGGHVGLPLSLALADAGLRVGIYDINDVTLDRIARGEMPFLENGAEGLLADVLPTGRLELGSSAEMIGRADTVVVVIGTPVDEFLGPSMRVFERAVDTSETERWWSCGARSTRAPRST
jgi:UDP-N-acetyl-D-mannosaminuronic acid dehydrogenase